MLPADERSRAQQDIRKAEQDIAELEKLIRQIQTEKSAAQQALQQTEKEIGDLEKNIRSLEAEQKKNEQEILEFEIEKGKFESRRRQQQKLVALQSRAAYQAGQSEPLRLFFNQQDPALVSHNLTYYQYLQQARQQQIKQFQATVQQLSELQAAIDLHQQELEQQKTQLQQQRDQLAELRQQRRQLVAELDKKQQGRQQQLSSRKQEQKKLNDLLAAIEQKLARQAEQERLRRERERQLALQQNQARIRQQQQAPARGGQQVSSQFSHPGGNFAQARGKLPWPVNGRLLAGFGSPRNDTRSKWDGVLIQAAEGHQVRVIHPGRVVFADWLRGSGLLVIVDHNDGYLSLYGHNQSLLVSAGDNLKAGQPIATVGNTGGQSQSALYFAIRKQGQATDPGQWCRSQG
ncbi:MAG: peptidoglycan DD-metalloendopeptidase family protein [Gammaproteobacteria bacterium]|nr:peptidoglycan DD-metalloendopeptidase family protein [Gammaproteobacteria bacterium]